MNPAKTHGAFSWSELVTSDPQAATDFYCKILGYTAETQEMENGPYTVLSDEGGYRAGIMGLPDPNMPPAWAFYVTVDDVDATIEKAKAMGADQIWPTMDVEEVGRMTGFLDPQKAYLAIMKYADPDMDGHEPNFADVFKTHGAFSWFELRTGDVEAAKSFYSELFGWSIEDWPMEAGNYSQIKVGEVGVGGIIPPPMPNVPNHWAAYITVDDSDAVAEAAKAAGGNVLASMDIPTVGRINVISDPQGAVFNVVTYVEMPESNESA